jgi:hypothetical protein
MKFFWYNSQYINIERVVRIEVSDNGAVLHWAEEHNRAGTPIHLRTDQWERIKTNFEFLN